MITKEKRARINPRRRDVRSSKLILCKNVLRANYNILKFQASDVSDSNQNHFYETIGDHVTFTTVKILKMNTKFDYFYSSVQ